MHSFEGIDKRIEVLKNNARAFKKYSRDLAASAQNRELQTTQPKESVIVTTQVQSSGVHGSRLENDDHKLV